MVSMDHGWPGPSSPQCCNGCNWCHGVMVTMVQWPTAAHTLQSTLFSLASTFPYESPTCLLLWKGHDASMHSQSWILGSSPAPDFCESATSPSTSRVYAPARSLSTLPGQAVPHRSEIPFPTFPLCPLRSERRMSPTSAYGGAFWAILHRRSSIGRLGFSEKLQERLLAPPCIDSYPHPPPYYPII
jgi:hypothetical protein